MKGSLGKQLLQGKRRMLSPSQQYSRMRLLILLYLWRNWFPFSKTTNLFFPFQIPTSRQSHKRHFQSAKGDERPLQTSGAPVKLSTYGERTRGLCLNWFSLSASIEFLVFCRVLETELLRCNSYRP